MSIEQGILGSRENYQASGKTQSEAIFEQYLESQYLKWGRIPESNEKRADYKLTDGPMTCVFEVKEFSNPQTKPSGGFSPCPPIQKKIRRASKNLKHYRGDCCALVLWNTSIYRSVSPEAVLSAAFGEKIYINRPPLGADPSIYYFSERSELRSDATRGSARLGIGPLSIESRMARALA